MSEPAVDNKVVGERGGNVRVKEGSGEREKKREREGQTRARRRAWGT